MLVRVYLDKGRVSDTPESAETQSPNLSYSEGVGSPVPAHKAQSGGPCREESPVERKVGAANSAH